ncbi:MAG: DUF3108 domain-containing protein [Deltaproteobacteria bacterium]|nr:DUF3108 domain-containing protein [Deltaproteobacteria bacterium]
MGRCGWALLSGVLLLLPGALRAESVPVFGPGETLIYDISYGPISGGKARILVGADTGVADREVWPIVVQARTSEGVGRLFAVQDRMVTLFDPLEEITLGYDFHAREGGKRRSTRARMDRERGKAHVVERSESEPERRRTYEVGPTCHDLTSAVFWLRGRPLEVGDREKVRIFTGARTWDLHGVVEARETLRTARGEQATVRVRFRTHRRGKLVKDRDITLWFSDDERHVPVKIHAEVFLGAVHAELQSYAPGLAR